jgi:hypothetical protein
LTDPAPRSPVERRPLLELESSVVGRRWSVVSQTAAQSAVALNLWGEWLEGFPADSEPPQMGGGRSAALFAELGEQILQPAFHSLGYVLGILRLQSANAAINQSPVNRCELGQPDSGRSGESCFRPKTQRGVVAIARRVSRQSCE